MMRRRLSSPALPTTNINRTIQSCSTAHGEKPARPPNSICSSMAATASGSAERAPPAITGSTNSSGGCKRAGCCPFDEIVAAHEPVLRGSKISVPALSSMVAVAILCRAETNFALSIRP